MEIDSRCCIPVKHGDFGWYIWAKAATFGSQPMCNEETLFVIFGITLRATTLTSRSISIGEESNYRRIKSERIHIYNEQPI